MGRLRFLPIFVVIIGPIASGKSTVADGLGDRFREAGRPVAVLDLDEVVETIGGFDDLPPQRFRQAQVVFGELVGAWLAEGFDVIAHGPLFQQHEQDALVRTVPEDVEPRRVRLHSTAEVALGRVEADPDRDPSSYERLVRETYDRVEQLLSTIPPSEWVYDTTTTDAPTIIGDLTAKLLGERHADR